MKKYPLFAIAVLIVIATAIATVLMLQNSDYIHRLQSFGYAGLFLVAVIAGSPLPVPSFCAALVVTLGSVLNPALVGLTAGFGFAIGRMLVYLLARGSSQLLQNGKFSDSVSGAYTKIGGGFLRKLKITEFLDYLKRHAMVAVFLMAAVPNPFLLPSIIALGAKKANSWQVFLACWAGKSIAYVCMAFVGYFGLHSLGIN